MARAADVAVREGGRSGNREAARKWPPASTGAATAEARAVTGYDSSGDQAGSEPKLGVGSFSSFRPVMSIV